MSSIAHKVSESAKEISRSRTIFRNFLRIAAFSGAIFASLSLWGFWRFGFALAGVAYLTGEPIYLDRETVDVGKVAPHSDQSAIIHIVNLTDSDIRLVGSRSSCTCTFLGELPATLEARGTMPLRVQIHPKPGKGRFEETIDIFTDHPTKKWARLRVTGEVRPG